MFSWISKSLAKLFLCQDQIASQFDQIGTSMNTGGASIATSDDFVLLKNMLHLSWLSTAEFHNMSHPFVYITSHVKRATSIGQLQPAIYALYRGLKPTFCFKTVLQKICLWIYGPCISPPGHFRQGFLLTFRFVVVRCSKTAAKHWLIQKIPLWHLMCQLRVSQLDFLIFVFCTFESLSTRSISRKVASSLPLASIGRGPAQVEEFGLFSQFSLESPFSSPQIRFRSIVKAIALWHIPRPLPCSCIVCCTSL